MPPLAVLLLPLAQIGASASPANAELALIRDANRLHDQASRFAAFLKSRGHTGEPKAGLFLLCRENKLPHVLAVLPGAPADEAGIRPGDDIVAIDGSLTKGLIEPQIRGLLEGNTAPRQLYVRRDTIPHESVTLTPRSLPCLTRAFDSLDTDYPARVAKTALEALNLILTVLAQRGEPPEKIRELAQTDLQNTAQLLGQTIDLFRARLYRATTDLCGVRYNDDP